jgi:hypothetical protein
MDRAAKATKRRADMIVPTPSSLVVDNICWVLSSGVVSEGKTSSGVALIFQIWVLLR